MTFLIILRVIEILCSFRLVLEGKTGKEIPESSKLEFLEKFLANNFALSEAEDHTYGPLNSGGIADLPLLRTLLLCLWEVMDSFWYKNSVGRNEKMISMNYSTSTSCWKPWRWVRLDQILTIRDLYIDSSLNPLAKFTSSSRSTEFKDILPWNISQMITKTFPISTRIIISYATNPNITLPWIQRHMYLRNCVLNYLTLSIQKILSWIV